MRFIFIISLVLISFTALAQASKKEKKEAAYQKALELIESQQFEFTARRALPPKVRAIDLSTNSNFLIVNKDKGKAQIPYFGRAFSGGYSSSDGGIRFDGTFESYDVQKNDKKNRATIKFKIRGEGDNYTCTLTIPGLQNVSLNVLSNNKQSINYTGFIQDLEEE
jgi:hypothetical protein